MAGSEEPYKFTIPFLLTTLRTPRAMNRIAAAATAATMTVVGIGVPSYPLSN
jgi:hypothetical protein